jgi:hypothetical protein
MQLRRTKLVQALRQLEITHNTQHFSRALSNALMEMVDVINPPKGVFKKLGKPRNDKAAWRSAHRIHKFHDPSLQ